MILKTLSGEMTAKEAQEALGIGESHFHALRDRVLQSGLDALELKAPGRQPEAPDPLAQENAKLRERIMRLEEDVEIERVRTEVALTMPHLLDRGAKKEK